MSAPLIDRSSDLKKLRAEGYELEVRTEPAVLLVHHVPYVNAKREVKYGTLITTLNLGGDRTIEPETHVAFFKCATPGEVPHTPEGRPLPHIINSNQKVGELVADHQISSKPKPRDKYTDYYEKVTTYVSVLGAAASLIEPSATAKTGRVRDQQADAVHVYADSATGRAGIGSVQQKLRVPKVAIVGMGGTGGYILDLLAKTWVREIHIYDRDTFQQHNAFRAPGAASLEDLDKLPSKVAYFHAVYSKFHKNIIPHPEHITEENVAQLRDMNFVFLAMEGSAKKMIVDKLREWGVPFIDTGIGVFDRGEKLGGIVRVTACPTNKSDHAEKRISFGHPDEDNEYDRNIQVADLNMLNAALAVIKWKKFAGFYHDLETEHQSCYEIDGNHILNEDQLDTGNQVQA